MAKISARPVPQGRRVRIRMYRQGIGDCFLLTFAGNPEPSHILIDCGVLSGTPGGKEKILQVAQNIQDETQGILQALVVTHEHWDHVSGFADARHIFDPMQMGEIWLGWTENPANPLARDLKRQNQQRLQAIHLALAHMANVEDLQLQAYGQGVEELLGFFGGPALGATLAAFSEKTAEAMAAVNNRTPAPTFWEPGQVIRRDWLPDVNVYVLAPPADKNMLNKLAGRAGSDMYGLTGADRAFAVALEEALAASEDLPEPSRAEQAAAALPFHPSLQWRDQKRILQDPHFGQLYRQYMAEPNTWQRIDHDWLLSVAQLGLQLDSATNNTSLVLAFELGDHGPVLLFAADAQIGSWKSWLTLPEFDTAALLRRTVFYKVGHHGSHNATLKEGGLEAMDSPGLVAAIPVNQDFANNSKHWQMPAPPLYARLKERTRGRILRADATWPTPHDPAPPGLSAQEWQHFTASVILDPGGLFIDYFL